MKNITSNSTITVLREIFSRFGLPKFIVSDNGTSFTSEEFQKFCDENGITHVKVTPYHPRSNGLAERTVRTFKERMRSSDLETDQHQRLHDFLFCYRNTVRRSTNRTPSELMFGRRLRSYFDLLKPDVMKNIEHEQIIQKRNHDKSALSNVVFMEGDHVWVNNPIGRGSVPGNIIRQTGPLSYIVDIDGIQRRKHSDHLRKRLSNDTPEVEFLPTPNQITQIENPVPRVDRETITFPGTSKATLKYSDIPDAEVRSSTTEFSNYESEMQNQENTAPPDGQSSVLRRNPTRLRRPPERYRE